MRNQRLRCISSELEAELGVKLFARQGKKVQLTEAGRSLRDQADHLLEYVAKLQQNMADLVSGEAGHVRLGAVEPTASLRLPPLLVEYCNPRPKVRLSLEVGGTDGISSRVADGALDLGICSPPAAQLGLLFEPLVVEQMALLIPQEHPLAQAETITPSDLTCQRLLLTEQHCAYREVTEKALLSRGANPYRASRLAVWAQSSARSRAGWASLFVPRLIVSPPPRGTLLREVEGIDLKLPIGLVRCANRTMPGRAQESLRSLLRARACRCVNWTALLMGQCGSGNDLHQDRWACPKHLHHHQPACS